MAGWGVLLGEVVKGVLGDTANKKNATVQDVKKKDSVLAGTEGPANTSGGNGGFASALAGAGVDKFTGAKKEDPIKKKPSAEWV